MRAKTSKAERERDKERKRKGEGRERERQREKEAQPAAAAAAAEGSDEVRSRDERAEPLARSIERSYHLCHAAVAVAATATAVVVPHHVEHSPWLMRASVHTSTTTIIHTPYHSTLRRVRCDFSARRAGGGGLEQRSHVECRHAE